VELEEPLIGLVPAFARLKNPIPRASAANFVSLVSQPYALQGVPNDGRAHIDTLAPGTVSSSPS
jgi:hypothetical protein